MDWIPVLKICIAFIILALASWSDWRTRMASDTYWIVMGTLGLAFLGLQIFQDGVSPLYYLFLVPLAIFFYDIFWDRPSLIGGEREEMPMALYIIAFITLGTLVAIFQTGQYLWQLMIIPIVILIIIVLYYLDIVKGGADAKALIALAVLFPVYPAFGELPLIHIPTNLAQYMFPFPILVLFNAALFVMIFPVSFMFYNLVKGHARFPVMFFGYMTRLSEARSKFVWTMERVENGERKTFLFPRGDDDHDEMLDQLEAVGAEEIWVTPKIPFLIPMTISLLFSALVGNIFFYFFS